MSELFRAIISRNLDEVKRLAENGADVNVKDIGDNTALHCASLFGSQEMVKLLVENGADANVRNKNGNTPLYHAIRSGSSELVKYLVEHGAEVTGQDNRWDMTMLQCACHMGDDAIIDYLLQHGAVKDLNKHSNSGDSPLTIACSRGHTSIVQTLLKFHVDIRQEKKLQCRNDEIMNILRQELKQSIKHREKIQILKEMNDEQLTQIGAPLKLFATDISLSLGSGAMGTSVFIGIMQDDSEVAVKRMYQHPLCVAENEKSILSLINTKKSEYVVNYRHFLKDNTFVYLILDLCEGTLKELVHASSLEHLQYHGSRMIKEILTGLAFLHDQGILHRDLKPSNVLVDSEGHMKLADFGISRVLNEDETTVLTDAKGTQGWMAAEVIQSIHEGGIVRLKKKCDVQVAGMIAFFILTKGEHPFGASLDRMANIAKGKPVNLKKLRDGDGRKFVSWLISPQIERRPYAQEALSHSFMVKAANHEGTKLTRLKYDLPVYPLVDPWENKR